MKLFFRVINTPLCRGALEDRNVFEIFKYFWEKHPQWSPTFIKEDTFKMKIPFLKSHKKLKLFLFGVYRFNIDNV